MINCGIFQFSELKNHLILSAYGHIHLSFIIYNYFYHSEIKLPFSILITWPMSVNLSFSQQVMNT